MLSFNTVQASRRHFSSYCQFDGTFKCSKAPRSLLHKVSLPPTACFVHDCSSCIRGNKTFLVNELQLFNPTSFVLRADPNISDSSSTTYECLTPEGTECLCDSGHCSGSPAYCSLRDCSANNSCYCSLTHKKTSLDTMTSDLQLHNPIFLTIDLCLMDKRSIISPAPHRRKLLEGERAKFKSHNLTIEFVDPILFLPDYGKVILRSEDFEHILTVPENLQINIPFELLAYKSTITIIYINHLGFTVTGQFHVSGKTICQLRQCFLCLEVFRHFSCLPKILQIIIYGVIILISLLSLLLLKAIFKSFIFILRFFMIILFAIFKIIKFIARCSLLVGVFLGNGIRDNLVACYMRLERHANQGAHIHTTSLVLLACTLLFTNVDADCNTQSIIASNLKTCNDLPDGTKSCDLVTTAEVSLPSIGSEVCLWFTDTQDNHLLSLTIKLEAVKCHFRTERQYYTFPVDARHISQISCIFNEYCGRGKHCIKRRLGNAGLKFESESQESRSYPGKSACLAGSLGVGCAMLTRASCNFYRTWYVPDLIHSYEVSKIQGHSCNYHIAVSHNENDTTSRISITDSAYTNTGIRITILGAYNQPHLHLHDDLVQRVGNPSEAYLTPTSDKNTPKSGQIGAVQANTSYTTSFIFDPEISQCDYFEDTLRCSTAPDALMKLTEAKESCASSPT